MHAVQYKSGHKRKHSLARCTCTFGGRVFFDDKSIHAQMFVVSVLVAKVGFAAAADVGPMARGKHAPEDPSVQVIKNIIK